MRSSSAATYKPCFLAAQCVWLPHVLLAYVVDGGMREMAQLTCYASHAHKGSGNGCRL